MRKNIIAVIILIVMFSVIAGCVAEIRTPPPPARVEVAPAPPYPNAIWIEGYWQHRYGNWVWVSGYWARRPWPGAVWIPGHWRETPRGWRWVPGHWR